MEGELRLYGNSNSTDFTEGKEGGKAERKKACGGTAGTTTDNSQWGGGG